jgi:hypothetical protein
MILLDKLNWGRSDVIFMDSMIKTHLYHFHLMLNERDKTDADWFWCPWVFLLFHFSTLVCKLEKKMSSGYLWYEICSSRMTISSSVKNNNLKKSRHEKNGITRKSQSLCQFDGLLYELILVLLKMNKKNWFLITFLRLHKKYGCKWYSDVVYSIDKNSLNKSKSCRCACMTYCVL